jgi:hypothetical protein
MPYPNTTASVIVIAQTSGSAVGGQYPFIEKQISGSNLFLITDSNGNLTGSGTIPTGNFNSLTVTGALTASTISASSGITASSIQDAGNLNVVGTSTLSTTNVTGLLSASGNITSSNIYDAGTLSVIGNTTLANVFATNITASTISASSGLTASAGYIQGNLFVGGTINATISGSINNAATASYVSGSTGYVTNFTSSNISASGYISASSEWVNNLTVANIATISQSNITSTVNATNYNVGALTVAGGVGVGKDLWVSGSTTIAGNLTILGTGSVVNISSSTVVIGANRVELNAFSPGGTSQRYAGIDVVDSGSTNNVTSSILWDSANNYWLLTNNQTGSAPITTGSAIILQGPTSSFGNENLLTPNYILKVQSQVGNMVTSSLSEIGSVLTYNGTISASTAISTSNVSVGSTLTALTGSFTTITIITGSAPGTGSVPTNPTASGMPGQIEVDNNFLYVYTTGVWKRVPLGTWAS